MFANRYSPFVQHLLKIPCFGEELHLGWQGILAELKKALQHHYKIFSLRPNL